MVVSQGAEGSRRGGTPGNEELRDSDWHLLGLWDGFLALNNARWQERLRGMRRCVFLPGGRDLRGPRDPGRELGRNTQAVCTQWR